MTDPAAVPRRPVPFWLHAWAVLTVGVTLVLLVLGQLVTTFRAGMADPVWPTEPWYLLNNYKLDLGYLIEHGHRIAGFAVGGFVAVLALGVWWTEPRKAARWAGLVGLVVLLAAFGDFHRQMIAQRDPGVRVALPAGPVAVMAAALLVVLGFGVSGVASGVRGSGLRLLAVAALVGVMVQGLLGGLRVRLNELIGPEFAQVHGVFAQVVFGLLVCLAVLTARPPATELPRATRRTLTALSVALLGLVFVQLLWGAMVRHSPNPLNQRLHFLTAFLVVAAAVWLIRAAFAAPAARPRVAAAGWLLAVLLVLQVGLGVEAWMGKFGTFTPPELEQITPQKAAIRTAHVLVGTAILATAAALAVVVRRSGSESESESGRENRSGLNPRTSSFTATVLPGGSSR
jgi:heme A synthase